MHRRSLLSVLAVPLLQVVIAQDCVPPGALLVVNGTNEVRTCLGDTIVLDASGSTLATGGPITTWIWSDGITLDTTFVPTIPRAFVTGGSWPIRVITVDSSGCSSLPSSPVMVLVSPPVSFNDHTVPVSACMGQEFTVEIAPVQGPMQNAGTVSWSAGGDPLHLPDDIGFDVVTGTTWHVADPNAVIEDLEQLGDICLELEHSNCGDMVIHLTCPNGSTVLLHDVGGNSDTFLGSPNEDPIDQVPGTPATYCFSASAQFGTWTECRPFGSTPNVVQLPGGRHMLIPGTYTPDGALDDLIGCPVNGPWTLTIMDSWVTDDGFLFGWSIDPQGDVVDVEGPVLGSAHADSSIWSGPDVTVVPTLPTRATLFLNEPSTHVLAYEVQDSYGCWHDTTFTINSYGPFVLDAGPDTVICNGPVDLEPTLFSAGQDLECTYTLVLRDGSGVGWSIGRAIVFIDGVGTSYYLTGAELVVRIPLYDASTFSLAYVEQPGNHNLDNSLLLLDAHGDTLYASPQGPSAGLLYADAIACSISGTVLEWTPTTGLTTPHELHTSAMTEADTEYVIAFTVAGAGGCTVRDTVQVRASHHAPLNILYDEAAGELCIGSSEMVDFDWIDHGGGPTIGTTVPCLDLPELWEGWSRSVVAYDAEGCVAYSDTATLCPTAHFTHSFGMLRINGGHPFYAWTLNGGDLLGETLNTVSTAFFGYGIYGVTFTTAYGCTVTGTYAHLPTDVAVTDEVQAAFRVIPVPNDGRFSLNFGKTARWGTLRVLDAMGRSVHERDLSRHAGDIFEMDCDLVPGTYVVELSDGARVAQQRMVVVGR